MKGISAVVADGVAGAAAVAAAVGMQPEWFGTVESVEPLPGWC